MAQSTISTAGKRTNFDSEFCGSIPLNFINLTQNHGVLIVLDKQTFNIVQVSDNCKDLFNLPVDGILNKNISTIISEDNLDEIKKRLDELNLSSQAPLGLELMSNDEKTSVNCTIHNKDNYALIEIEKVKPIEGNQTFTHLHQKLKFIVAKVKDAQSIDEFCAISASEIKTLSGFDRVMIYKFDEDWNGLVIAEAKEEELEPYLHLRFPASDIPKSARDLYLRNPYRLIPDIAAKPSRLIPVMNPITQSFTDLSECNLRAVPAVHLEYLKNMNVISSMSIPIIKEGKLWGLISCHHRVAKLPSYEMLSCFELLAEIISSQVSAKENHTLYESKSKLVSINGKILERIYREDSLSKILLDESSDLLKLLKLDGAAIVSDNEIVAKGKTPDEAEIKSLIDWLERRNSPKVFFSDSLPKIYLEPLKGNFAGMISLSIDPNKKIYVLGFRQERIYSIEWGGNPYEAFKIEKDGKTYHPRNSFSKWKETVKNTSESWRKEEIEAAEMLRGNILEKIVIGN